MLFIEHGLQIRAIGKNSEEKITGTLKIISHSKGVAYALCFIKGYFDERSKVSNISKFAQDEDNNYPDAIELNVMLAPHQGKHQITSSLPCRNNVALRHKTDPISSEIEGTVLFIETSFGLVISAHSIDGFHPETEAIIEQFIINKQANKENLLEEIETKVRAVFKINRCLI